MKTFISIDINEYESPLDLISHLLEMNQIDIYDIPIFDITEQYLEVINSNNFETLNMELASEFLLMAATLMQIKSRMLLPDQKDGEYDIEGHDPREELVLRLLAYRRNKYMANQLMVNFNKHQGVYLKHLSSPQSLGLDVEIIEDHLNADKFKQAIELVKKRNTARFNSQNQRIKQLLKKEKFSVKDKMLEIVKKVFQKSRLFFTDLFPAAKSSKPERISGFLAILELIKQDKIVVKQPNPFSAMMIELEPEVKTAIASEQEKNILIVNIEDKKTG